MLYFHTSYTERRSVMKKRDLQGYRKNFIKFLTGFMVIFPWITYLRLSQLSEAEQAIFVSYEGISIDFFLYHKQVALIIMAVVTMLWFVGERFLPQKVDNNVPLFKGQNKFLFILAGVFVVGAVVSTLFSQYQKNALWGSPTVGEGLWTLLAYIVLIFVFYNYFANEYGMSMLKNGIVLLSGITVVLTLVEWFYKPLLEIGLVQFLVAPSQYREVVSSMEASVFESAISLTFYNPGYFGGFVCMLLPFVLLYCLQAKKLAEKLLYGVLTAGLLFGVVVANTTTALYIAMLEVVLILALYVISNGAGGKSDVTSKKRMLLQTGGVFVATVVALILSGVISGNSFLNIFSNANSATNSIVKERFEVVDIELKGNQVVLAGTEAELVIAYEGARIRFYDGAGKELSPTSVDTALVFDEPAYKDLKVTIGSVSNELEGVNLALLVDAGYQSTIDFFLLDTGVFAGVGQGGAVLTDIEDAGTPEALKSFYGMFTGRGYAWVNSLPILKDTLLIGKGPGNFAFYFKQFDYVGLLDTHKNVNQIIDKPHNAYLQYAINIGLPAAIAFFGIFVGVLIKAVKVFWKNRNHMITMKSSGFHIAAMVSLVGFLIYSIINDSMVTVTPIVCMIAGALLASCYMVDKKK